jgi:two-component system, NarL family, sensor histidine kinase UhpB
VQAGRRWFEGRIAPIRRAPEDEPIALMLAHDITDRKRAEEQLRQLAEARRAFARQLISVQEQERQRLARELHDDLGQILTALKLECKTIADRADDPDRVRSGIGGLVERLNVAMTSVRNLVRGLHPNVLTDIGLGAALDSMCRRITQSTTLACGVDVDASADALPAELATAVYRIAQEALTNVVRHAGADRVWLRLVVDEGSVTLLVEDDGHGAETAALPERGTLGITSMRERAALLGGALSLDPSSHGGLCVRAVIPTR